MTPESPVTERIEMTLQVAESVVDISMSGVQIDCGREIIDAATSALMNTVQRGRRDAERERVHPRGEDEDDGLGSLLPIEVERRVH